MPAFPNALGTTKSTLQHCSTGQHKSPAEDSTSIQTYLPMVHATPQSSHKIIILIFESPSTVQYFSHDQQQWRCPCTPATAASATSSLSFSSTHNNQHAVNVQPIHDSNSTQTTLSETASVLTPSFEELMNKHCWAPAQCLGANSKKKNI